MGTNERLGKTDNIDEYQISWMESSFHPLSISLNKYGSKKAMGTHGAKVLIMCPLIIQNQVNISGVVSLQFFFSWGLFIFNCFLLLYIVHEFYFSKESVHNGGIQRHVGCD